MQVLLWGLLIGNIICLLATSFRMLDRKGPGHAIFGFVFWIYAFVWGWRAVRSKGDKQFMTAWSIFLGLYMTVQFMASQI